MVVTEQRINEVLGTDKDLTVAMKIDDRDKKKLMMILSQNLYQDPIGSIVREYVSNALDAQREIGNDEPIVVKLTKENGQFVFNVIDNGIGLSPERVENVFSKYLSSTKEADKNQLGYYGLGSKSALSYVDSFTIHSRYEGKLYSYLMLKGEEGTELSLLDINDTTDHNGVTIVINLKESDDYEIFLEKIRTQLCYFEGVYIDTYYDDINTDYKIIKTDNWKYSELNQDPNLHLCLDNVYYPLDFNKLGIETIKMPIGLNFSLNDGIMPIPSREGFMYTPDVKEMILNRIKAIGIEFIEKWNAISPNASTLEAAHDMHDHWGTITLYHEEENGLVIKHIAIKVDKKLEKITDLKMKSVCLSLFPNMDVDKLYTNRSYLLQEYQIYGKSENNTYQTKFGYKRREESEALNIYDIDSRLRTIYLLKTGEVLTKLQITYLKWLKRDFLIIRKHSSTKLGKINKDKYYDQHHYIGLLDLYKEPKDKWRNLIKEYQALIKTYTNQFLELENIVPSKDFLEWKETCKSIRKVAKRNTKEEITFCEIYYSTRTNSKSKFLVYKDNKRVIKVSDLSKQQGLFIYSKDQDEFISEELYNLFINDKKIHVVVLSERNYQKIIKEKKLHNWIKVEDFWKTKNKWIANYLTRFLLDKSYNLLKKPSLNTNSTILDKKSYSDFQAIYQYFCSFSIPKHITEDWLYGKLYLYNKNNWLKNDQINLFKKVLIDIYKFDFLNVLNFHYEDKKLLKKFALTLYLKQKEEDKIKGITSYKQIDIDKVITHVLTPVEEKNVNTKENLDLLEDLDEEITVINELIEVDTL